MPSNIKITRTHMHARVKNAPRHRRWQQRPYGNHTGPSGCADGAGGRSRNAQAPPCPLSGGAQDPRTRGYTHRCAHTRVCAHTCPGTRVCARTRCPAHACVCAHTCLPAHACVCTHVPVHTRVFGLTRAPGRAPPTFPHVHLCQVNTHMHLEICITHVTHHIYKEIHEKKKIVYILYFSDVFSHVSPDLLPQPRRAGKEQREGVWRNLS